MNDKTITMYNLARMYEYLQDINDLCENYNYDMDRILENKFNKHAINMCLVQIGEHANTIRKYDKKLYLDENLCLFQIKGMRDRITHSYGNIDYSIIKRVLINDVPTLKGKLEALVDYELLNNPYILFENEYDDIVNDLENENEYELEP